MQRKNNKEHKKQHTVPKVYLDNFTDKNGSLWMFNPNLSIYSNAPQNTLTRKYYYDVKFGNNRSLIIEKGYLANLEGEYANIYREKISKYQPLTDEEKAKLSIFIATQFTRVPRVRDSIRGFIDQIEEMTKPFKNLTDEEKKKMSGHSPIPHNNQDSMSVEDLIKMKDTLDSDHSLMLPKLAIQLAPILFDMKWGFMAYKNTDNSFITSDDPCVLVNPALEEHYGLDHFYSSPGLAQSGVEVMLPLSPDIALLCGWKMNTDRLYIPVTKVQVDNANKRQLRHGGLIIANSKKMSETIKNYIRWRKLNYPVRNVLIDPAVLDNSRITDNELIEYALREGHLDHVK